MKFFKKGIKVLSIAILLLSLNKSAFPQMRQVYLDNTANNEINKISFYSANEGYIGFTDWVGYTTDSGRTFTKKYITLSNVNFNGYPVNLTFGFGISGAKAFSQNALIVYGDYGLVPSILYSSDGGNTFTLIYHSQYDPLTLRTGITDMIFPQDNIVGYAIDADRVLKTTNGGLSWSVSITAPESFFDHLEGVDNADIFALSTAYSTNKLIKTTNGGISWQSVNLPALSTDKMSYATFITANTGWLSMNNTDNNGSFYKTINGGSSWILQNNIEATPFNCYKMKFINDNVGFALSGQNTVFKTVNSGVIWEPLPRDNNYAYLGYSHNDLQIFSATRLWVGGGHGFLELNTNAGGPTLPKAYFNIDTIGLDATGNVSLHNYSGTGYTYKWILNGIQISTTYNSSYIHNIDRAKDTVTLIVSNGTGSDTAIKYQYFYPPIKITSFIPTAAGIGKTVTITGSNFTGTTFVSFGGIAATSFTVTSSTTIDAIVGTGASGIVKVGSAVAHASLGGFTFIDPPVITSFAPLSAAAGTVVTITGNNLTGATAVSFAGVAAASYTVISSTTISATVPSGNSGSISVTTPGGIDSLAGFISVPRISSFTPLQGTQGTILHINGTSFTGATGVSINGINVVSFTVNSSTSITAIVGLGGTGNVMVTKAAGSSSLPGFTWFSNPVITSFSPASGPVGTTVTITGTGFNGIPANNIVYFGAVRAIVTGGSSTSLTVTVPVGATFDPVTVTSNNLIAYSDKPFLVTFANGGSITATSFATTFVIHTGTDTGPMNIALGDLDGDGKSDLVVSDYTSPSTNDGVLIYRNTSTITAVSFSSPVIIGNLDYKGASVADFDGDGKLDLAIINGASIAIFLNTSTPGSISFVPSALLTTSIGPGSIAISDIDGDGKPDIAVSNNIFRNTSEPGQVSFAPVINYPASGGNILLTDIDGDKKVDLVIPGPVSNSISVLKNNSTKGNISFPAALNFEGYSNSNLRAADIDRDGKTDLVSSDINGSKVAIMVNKSTSGSIAFAPVTELNATAAPYGVEVSDLDGDGKPDIAAALFNYNLSVFKNTTTSGKASFAPKTDYISGASLTDMLALGDINGDGKNDAIVTSETRHSITIHLNNVTPAPFIQSFTPVIGVEGISVTITGNNFTGVTAVTFGGVPAASFLVNSPISITAIVGIGAAGDVAVTNNYGTGVRPGFVFGNPPQITSVSPAFAPIGATVTINGNNFSSVPLDNIVYFGGVKAVVSSSTLNKITAVVPVSAGPQPITVTINHLTAYSAQLFSVTFPGGGSSFTAASFAPRVDRTLGGKGTLTDMDGDGKIDLVMAQGANGFVVARNTSVSGSISFDANVKINSGGAPLGLTTGDLDGDGKPDVVLYSYDSSSISVVLNTSTVGNVSFSGTSSYLTGVSTTRPLDVIINDIDGDGKPDIIAANYYSQTISVFRNLSTLGNVILDARIDYLLDGYPTGVTVRDMDGDGKPDLVASVNGPNVATVFTNTSVPGTISFAQKVNFAAGNWPNAVKVSDIDGDGKLDIVIPNINGNTVSFLHNLSTQGNISFAVKQDYLSGDGPNSVAIGDLDGDGKPDIAEQNNYSGYSVSVLKNISSPGNIILQPKFDYVLGSYPGSSSIEDIDGDGKPDITVYISGGTTSFFRNLTSSAYALQLCANSDTILTTNLSGATYQWQQNTGSGFVNISDNSNFSGCTTGILRINNIPVTWTGFQYRCLVDFNIGIVTTISVFSVPMAGAGNDTTLCAGTSVQLSGSGGGIYSWSPSTGLSDPSVANPVATPATSTLYVLTVFNGGLCSAKDTVVVTVTPIPELPAVSISTPDSIICMSSVATFTAIATNAGTNPIYQWSINAVNAGSNNTVFTSSSLVNNDDVKVTLTSNLACITNPVIVSNNISIDVQQLDVPIVTITDRIYTITNPDTAATYIWQTESNSIWTDVVPVAGDITYTAPGAGMNRVKVIKGKCTNYSAPLAAIIRVENAPYSIYLYPNPANGIVVIDSIGLSQKWEMLDVTNTEGKQAISPVSLKNKTSVTIDVSTLPRGVYFAVLRRKTGIPFSIKFVKR